MGQRRAKGADGQLRREFRVEVATPSESKLPAKYKLTEDRQEDSGKAIYASKWFSTIKSARDELIRTAKLVEGEGCKVIVFFEIRGPAESEASS